MKNPFSKPRSTTPAGKLDEAAVRQALSAVQAADMDGDIVSLGMVQNVLVTDGKVIFSLEVPANRAQTLEPVRAAAEKAVASLPGAKSVTAVMTAERKAGDPSTTPAPPPPPATPQRRAPGGAGPKAGVPGIGKIIAVASGKGGVGKSTTTVNLALALQMQGLRVGVMDADIYGPSMPRMFGLTGKPEARDNKLVPMEAFGLKIMSMGFLVEEEAPMIWRGPMVISALTQLLREVHWGPLDVLVVDMPPGTGDAQLTMSQQVPLAGSVIVSTPQDIALIDARKGLNMFKKVEVPILGIVENMSYFLCPNCGERSDIFGHGGARDEAEKLGVPFLGEVPLHMDIRTHSDGGTPIVQAQPDGSHAEAYMHIAKGVTESLAADTHEAPTITFE
ncbi:MAG: Mrp/NBP35 family ATP-binding protein [Pseudomonadota bacterium]